MSMSKITMLMAAALVGAGLCAAEPADAPKPEGGKPAMRGKRGPGGPGSMMERMQQTFQLNDEEKAALKTSDDAVKEQIKPTREKMQADIKAIREKAQAEIKPILEKAFDERLKTLKTAADRLTDEKAKTRAGKMIEMMEQRRDQMLDMQAKRLLAGDRQAFGGGRRGPRPDGDGPRGPHGERGPRGPRPPMDKE